MGRCSGNEYGVGRMSGLCVEFGRAGDSCLSYFSRNEYYELMRRVGAGLMEPMLAVETAGEPLFWKCDR